MTSKPDGVAEELAGYRVEDDYEHEHEHERAAQPEPSDATARSTAG
jgi:hypothetical protein